MFRDLKNNNQGVIFVTVLIIILIAMVLAISVLSLNISQVKNTENELKHIQAKIVSEGALAQIVAEQLSGGAPGNSMTYSETIGNATYSVSTNIDSSGASPGDSESAPLTIDVDF